MCVCVFQVRTKTVCQCVEFYYLSKKLQDKQKKQKEEDERRDVELDQQKSVRNIKRSHEELKIAFFPPFVNMFCLFILHLNAPCPAFFLPVVSSCGGLSVLMIL